MEEFVVLMGVTLYLVLVVVILFAAGMLLARIVDREE